MNPNDTESFDEKRIDLEAAEWVAKRAGGFSPADQDAFFEWLSIDPRHGEWYARHSKTWNSLNLLAEWMPEHSDGPNADLLKFRARKRRWGWVGGVAAVLAVGIYIFLDPAAPTEGPKPASGARDFAAAVYESHAMEDGSVIELNSGAALKVDYHESERRVELISNEAHFEVAKDASRPFVVSVRGVEIQAVGTAFNVRLAGDEVEVLVTEGKVRVRRRESASGSGLVGAELVAGQVSLVSLSDAAASPSVSFVSASEMDQMLGWKPKLLNFDSTPLSEVVAEFNRRNDLKMEIRDPNLEERLIVASFRAANVNHFVEVLNLTMGVEATRESETLITLRGGAPE